MISWNAVTEKSYTDVTSKDVAPLLLVWAEHEVLLKWLAVGPSLLSVPVVYRCFLLYLRIMWPQGELDLFVDLGQNQLHFYFIFFSCEFACRFNGELIKHALYVFRLDANTSVSELSWELRWRVSCNFSFIWIKHHMKSKICVFKNLGCFEGCCFTLYIWQDI